MCIYIYIYIYIYIHTYILRYTQTYLRLYPCPCACVCIVCVYVYMYVYIYIYIERERYTHTHTHTVCVLYDTCKHPARIIHANKIDYAYRAKATEKRERELSEAAQKTWRSTTQVDGKTSGRYLLVPSPRLFVQLLPPETARCYQ